MTDDQKEIEVLPVPRKRLFRISNSLMDKDMFAALILQFDGDVDIHGVTFTDIDRAGK